MTLHYFAYGSNMSPRRLRARIPGARVEGTYTLSGHELRIHKVGRDGSAKADAWFTGNPYHFIHGVLYTIDECEKVYLDRAEGLGNGYEEKSVVLYGQDGLPVKGFLYYATSIDSNLLPFDWYLEHIVRGAEFARLPGSYIGKLQSITTLADPDYIRRLRERALYNGGPDKTSQSGVTR